jgi:hypothetical protein
MGSPLHGFVWSTENWFLSPSRPCTDELPVMCIEMSPSAVCVLGCLTSYESHSFFCFFFVFFIVQLPGTGTPTPFTGTGTSIVTPPQTKPVDTPAPTSVAEPRCRIMFVTSKRNRCVCVAKYEQARAETIFIWRLAIPHGGSFGGIAEADAFCEQMAMSVNATATLRGRISSSMTYRALLGNGGESWGDVIRRLQIGSRCLENANRGVSSMCLCLCCCCCCCWELC